MEKPQKVRKSGLTFAVEGGDQRLRDAINKNVTQEDLPHTCAIAFAGGWNSVKLYYMLGLPTETDEDIIGIAQMADEVFALLAHERKVQKPRCQDNHIDVVLHPQAAQPLPVGGADKHRGVSAPREPLCAPASPHAM